MIRKFILAVFIILPGTQAFSQGFGIPSKSGGIGFGNLPRFSGIRLNFIDRNVEKISGLNMTVWQPKSESDQTGDMNGISLGLPLAMGTENRNGLGIGVAGVGTKNNLSGINIGGLGVGAGGAIKGINIGGLGIGSGGDLKGISIGGLGAGSGGDVKGFTFGGLGVGAGKSLKGISIGGLGVGSGGTVSGISIGGLGVGAGGDLSGIQIGGIGVGSGGSIKGISIAGIGLGTGKEVMGLAIAGIAVGAPRIRALVIAPAAGGNDLKGLFIVPAYLQVGGKGADETEVVLNGVSISAFNHVKGTQKGVALGVFNYTRTQRGVQFGLLNYVKDNPKGLKLLPVFNMHFGKKSD